MKTCILLATLCLLGVASAAPATNGLENDLQDFLNLLPLQDIIDLTEKYKNDKEIQEAIEFLHGDEFAKIWDQLSGNKEFKDLVYYLNDAGLPVVDQLNMLASVLGLPAFPERLHFGKRSVERTGEMKGYFDELIALLPKEQIKALFNEKLKTSKEFAELYKKLSSADFQKIVKFVKDSPEITNSLNKLRAHGVDVDGYVEVVVRIFGWKQ